MATGKQKKAARKLSEDIGRPLGTIMREVGYSLSTSLTPQRMTETKGWQELMNEALPDALLMEKHRELLTVPKLIRTRKIGAEFEEQEESLDVNAISKGLDMGYKLKGKYAPEKHINVDVKLEPSDKIKKFAYGLLESQRRGNNTSDGAVPQSLGSSE